LFNGQLSLPAEKISGATDTWLLGINNGFYVGWNCILPPFVQFTKENGAIYFKLIEVNIG